MDGLISRRGRRPWAAAGVERGQRVLDGLGGGFAEELLDEDHQGDGAVVGRDRPTGRRSNTTGSLLEEAELPLELGVRVTVDLTELERLSQQGGSGEVAAAMPVDLSHTSG